uniref:Uncharacterized protein n=1 Tax=Anguilla anguilla TaxID=7936 RepID=A0A0E9UYI8_ANGAN
MSHDFSTSAIPILKCHGSQQVTLLSELYHSQEKIPNKASRHPSSLLSH